MRWTIVLLFSLSAFSQPPQPSSEEDAEGWIRLTLTDPAEPAPVTEPAPEPPTGLERSMRDDAQPIVMAGMVALLFFMLQAKRAPGR